MVAALAALMGLLAYAIFAAVAHGSAIDAQVRALSAENSRLQQQIDERRTQIGEANNRDWLQEQARKLGLVFPGESIYILTTPGASRPATGGINAALPSYAPKPVATPTPSPSPPPMGTAGAVPRAVTSPTPQAFAPPSPSPH